MPLFWENSDEKNVTGREFQKFGKMAELSGSKINVTDLETPNKIFNFRSDYWSFLEPVSTRSITREVALGTLHSRVLTRWFDVFFSSFVNVTEF